MPLLVGNETSEATEKTYEKEKAFGGTFAAAHTGTVEVLHVKTKNGVTENEFDIGLYEESGKLFHKKTGKLAASAEGTVEATGFSVKVTKGTSYRLAAIPVLGSCKVKYKKEAGHELLEKVALAKKELLEGSTWAKEPESLNLTIWATGTEEEGVEEANPIVMLI